MKRILTFFLIISFLLCSCSFSFIKEEPPKEEPPKIEQPKNTEFGVGYVEEEHFNPLITKNKENLEVANLVYEGLFELDASFAPHPVLCESFSMEGNQYRFRLKNGILFSDGSPLTPSDVVYSLRRALTEDSYYASRLSNISGIYADGKDICISLHRANANLPRLLDVPIIKEKTADSKISLGTGPYAIVYNEEKKDYHLTANPHWHKQAGLPFQTIQMIQTGGGDQLIWGFESTSVDLVTLDPTGPNPLQFRGEYETREIPTSVMVYLGFNLRSRTFQSTALRRAISCAIDRQAAVDQDYALRAQPSLLPVHPLSSAYDETIAKPLAYSLENAYALFKEAGYYDQNNDGKIDGGGDRSFTLLVNSENKSRVALGQRICQALIDFGFSAKLRQEKWEDYEKSLKSGDFDLYLAETNLRGDFNLDSLLRSDGSLNYGKYSESETNTQLDAYHNTELEHNSITSAFYTHFVQTVPIIPILFKKHAAITHRDFFSSIASTQRNTYYHFETWKVVS